MTKAVSSPVLRIESLSELYRAEPEILHRISQWPNGHKLFITHPLRALADANVQLSEAAHRELLKLEPSLAMLSLTAYESLKARGHTEQHVRVHLKGLFRRPR